MAGKSKSYITILLIGVLLLWSLPTPVSAETPPVMEVGTMDEFLQAMEGPPYVKRIVLTQSIEGWVYAGHPLAVPEGWNPAFAVVLCSGHCIIELNGHTIKAHLGIMDDFVDFIAVEPDGNLTVIGGTIEVTGMNEDGIDNAVPLSNRGHCRLSDVTLNGAYGLFGYPDATIMIESGQFLGDTYYGFENFGHTTIYDGIFEGALGGFWQGSIPTSRVAIYNGHFKGGVHSVFSEMGAIAEMVTTGSRMFDKETGQPVSWENPFEVVEPVQVVAESSESITGYLMQTGPYAYSVLQGEGTLVPVGDLVEIRLDHFPVGYLPYRVYANQTEITASRDGYNHYYFDMAAENVQIVVDFKEVREGNQVHYFTIGEHQLTYHDNGAVTQLEMDVAPYISNNRAMLPVRFVGEALNLEVSFHDATREILLTGADHKVVLSLDHNVGTIGSDRIALDAKPEVVNGRTMLPVGEIAVLMGLDRYDEYDPDGFLYWYADAQTVMITRPTS